MMIFVPVSAFVLVGSLWFIGITLYLKKRQSSASKLIVQRMGGGIPVGPDGREADSEDALVLRLWRDGKMVTTTIHNRVRRQPKLTFMEHIRHSSGWNVSATTLFVMPAAASGLAVLMMVVLTHNIVFALLVGAIPPAVPWFLVKRGIAKQTDLFEQQFAEALSLAARSLRAGQPLMAAFSIIVSEMSPPVSTMFARIQQDQTMGVGLNDAILNAAADSDNQDMKLFAAGMSIQIRSGGNLADMVERLAQVIRERIKIHRRAKVLTSETQLSKKILMAIPFGIFIVLYLVNPNYIEPLYTTHQGKILLVICAVLLTLGGWMMNRIATLRY